MANMSYCRFENTSRDLADCILEMDGVGTVEEMDLSDSERAAMDWMADQCRQYLLYHAHLVETTEVD